MNEHLRSMVAPCAGRGTRMGCAASKSMLRVHGRPLLQYIVEYWRRDCEMWYFVLNPDDVETVSFVESLDVNFKILVQEEPRGIGDAVLLAGDSVTGPFTVALGDCVVSGVFDFTGPRGAGIGIWEQASPVDVSRNYGAVLERGGGRVLRVEEKPADPSGMKCGMGVYFLTPDIFPAIRATPPDAGGYVQITSALQTFIDMGNILAPVPFSGNYINVNDRSDLERAESVI